MPLSVVTGPSQKPVWGPPVFNSKLGHLATKHSRLMLRRQPLLKLKTQHGIQYLQAFLVQFTPKKLNFRPKYDQFKPNFD